MPTEIATWRYRMRCSLAVTTTILAAAGLMLPMNEARADGAATQATGGATVSSSVADASSSQAQSDFFTDWFNMVTRTQDAQPHWMTPLVTVTPRLEQEFRYDEFAERLPTGQKLNNFDAGKGLEIVPSYDTEVILGMPPFEEKSAVHKKEGFTGWGDYPFLLMKYRFLSANEQQGNYILTGFLQFSAPTGDQAFSNNVWIVQPTIAAGKGFGDFDVQATISEQFPFNGKTDTITTNYGKPVLANVAFQYHLVDILWPELEFNYTWWPDGSKEGKQQLFVTPGIIFGRFPIHDRVKLIFGVGYQSALTPHTPAYNNNVVFTARTTF